ncbi:MAG TPA: DUF2232 domain-containing protein [Longimicrobiaceae bacterium]|nr:DUF2232 domain-containing protein [Longimicrobiaceae bacterium]
MTQEEGRDRGKIGTAALLMAAGASLSSLAALTLSLLMLVLLPRSPRGIAAGVLGGAVAVLLLPSPAGPGAALFAWTTTVAAAFLVATLVRPGWTFLPRALAALALGFAGVGGWLTVSGRWAALDRGVRALTRTASEAWIRRLSTEVPDTTWASALETSIRGVAELQWRVFPALLALQSLAALALGWWIFARFAPDGERWMQLRPLREFRFSDHLVWIVVAGVVLALLPVGAGAARVGANALFFMGGLYALRGLGVVLFTTGISPVLLAVLVGIFALSPLVHIVLAVALLVGLGDTWLDVRRRAALAPRA